MAERLTPLLSQYRRIKDRYPETLLLFRVGDFYEMFYEDAEIGARVLNLTLTSRPHGSNFRVPLAGIPVKVLDSYVARLVNQGFKIAICDQLEEPDRNKPVVHRDVVEIITPGTITRAPLLDAQKNNYIMALSPAGDVWGMAFADLTTGEFRVGEIKTANILEEVATIAPAEILLPQRWEGNISFENQCRITRIDDYYFTEEFAFDKLTAQLGVMTLAGFGVEHLTEGVCAAGAVLHYLEHTQRSTIPHLRRVTPYLSGEHLLIDRISRHNLELIERLHPDDGRRDFSGTLLWVLDRTKTPGGARMLRRWLLAPLLSAEKINRRLDAVEELIQSGTTLSELRELLGKIGDIERVGSRIALERANSRDLVALRNWLMVVPDIKKLLSQFRCEQLKQNHDLIGDFSSIVNDISQVLVDAPPSAITEGGLIRKGYNQELDELREIAGNAKEFIARIQATERQHTGIPNLRVGYNSVFGYYIEVTKSYLSLVPRHYIRKQTVANAERFITPQLKEYESMIINAEERIRNLEYELFIQLRSRIAGYTSQLLNLAAILAELDVFVSLALTARERNYVRPAVDESQVIEIRAGRHPVVEIMSKEQFIPNDTIVDSNEQQILIVTGPNMAGKSTYLRQVALIVIMAQMGSFVPALYARVGIVDKVFTRIGASDDVARGVSTFLAEMIETANILNNATSRSLVVLDEIGRGTATYDGLAIAWATVEHLHGDERFCPRTIFATHYHELTAIAKLLPRVKNYNFLVREKGDQVLFLRKISPGPADKSYGIAVARLAGLPAPVLKRAKELLCHFTKQEQFDLSALTTSSEILVTAERPLPNPVIERLRSLNVNELTPLQALSLLVELQQLVRSK
ncbi:MAG: DNA mismatch repair protein MutS [bacterium]